MVKLTVLADLGNAYSILMNDLANLISVGGKVGTVWVTHTVPN